MTMPYSCPPLKRSYETVSEVRQALIRYFDFYNRCHPHLTLDGKIPDTAYFNQPAARRSGLTRGEFT